MSKKQPDVLLCAYIAVALAPDLSGNARRVAGAILGHWNRRSGRCDPSVERIAGMLGIDRATVLRATAELCTGDARLFDKASHGGKGHRAAYAPRWEVLRAVVEDWNARMVSGAPAAKVAKVRRSTSQDCDVERRRTATQTYRRNLSKEPDAVSPSPPPPPQKARTRKPTGPVPGQGWLLLPLPGSREQAAEQAAQKRVMQDLRTIGAEVYAHVAAAATPDMLAEAAVSERQRRGSGAAALIETVRRAAG
jgi:hypothetical protein